MSVNTSYNPQFFEDEKIPMSVMLQHLLLCYKYGIKQLYYFNTYDGQGELDVDKLAAQVQEPDVQEQELTAVDQEDCDSCVI
jgi:ribonucleoside-diphosphate reductase alpha chain